LKLLKCKYTPIEGLSTNQGDFMIYERTEDPNIIKEIKTIESEIHLDKLEAAIRKLQEQIRSIPRPKEEPDQETLDYWNEMTLPSLELENELREKEELLEQLRGL